MSPPAYKCLDVDNAVFLFVDHQTGLCQLVRDFEPGEFHTNVLGLIRLATYFKIPAVLTTSFDTGPNGPMVKEILEALPDAPLIRRPGQINAMDNEDFVNAIKATGRKQVVIAGVLTEVCVAFPTLSLIEQGYDVFVATDASGTFSVATREAAHKRMTQAGAQMMSWIAIAGELQRDWRRDIEGFGNIWTDFIPGYKLVAQSYEAGKNNA
ncbi:Isochorismatase-like protein [Aspergillus karnatakaensis]|uniref:hydrolase n=1 Tax=Aspergillus karnatakaensis TaxID=1810916 RepID=UPI003CCDEBA4